MQCKTIWLRFNLTFFNSDIGVKSSSWLGVCFFGVATLLLFRISNYPFTELGFPALRKKVVISEHSTSRRESK